MTDTYLPLSVDREVRIKPINWKHAHDVWYFDADGAIPRQDYDDNGDTLRHDDSQLWTPLSVVSIPNPHSGPAWCHLSVLFDRPFVWMGDDRRRLNRRTWGATEINTINDYGRDDLREVARSERVFYPDGYPAANGRHKAQTGQTVWRPKTRRLPPGQTRNIWVASSLEIDADSPRGGDAMSWPVCRRFGDITVAWSWEQ